MHEHLRKPGQSADLDELERAIVRQSRLLMNLTDAARKNHSAITALIALAQALIESHPSPNVLERSFLDQIDSIGSLAISPSHAEMYRDDIQKINSFILDVIRRRNASTGGVSD